MASGLHGRELEGCAFPQYDWGRSSSFPVCPCHHNTHTCSVLIGFVWFLDFLKIPKIANSEWKFCSGILVKISMVLCELRKRRPEDWVKYLLKKTTQSSVFAVTLYLFLITMFSYHVLGSYFARDASYSHAYCPPGLKTNIMFVARVLVGDFVKGHETYVRPPAKSSNGLRFYDSCVDDEFNPSIFVVFEKYQIYPEYLIEYKEEQKHCIVS